MTSEPGKQKAWKALNDMRKIWRSNMPREVKLPFFLATVVSVLYGCEASTLTPSLEKSLNGCYTGMLRTGLNVSWQDHVTTRRCMVRSQEWVTRSRCGGYNWWATAIGIQSYLPTTPSSGSQVLGTETKEGQRKHTLMS